MKRNNYSIGIMLVFIGLLIILLNLKLFSFNWLLFLLSMGLIVAYFPEKRMGYMVSGLVILVISLVFLANQYIFPGMDIRGFLFLWILGILSLILYGRQDNNGFLLVGSILLVLGTYSLIRETSPSNANWILFSLLSVASYITYIVEYKKFGIRWPKYLSILLASVALILLFASGLTISFSLYKLIAYIISILLIAIGIRIVYNITRSRR